MRTTHRLGLALALALSVSATARADFVNGGFETGDFTGWTLTPTPNGRTAVQTVEPFDIDFGGPLPVSNAAKLAVGQVTFMSGVPAGMELTQTLALVGGVQYTISFDWAAFRATSGTNAQGGIFDLIVDGVSLATAQAGSTSSTTQRFGHLEALFTPPATGNYVVGARVQRPFTVPADLFQYMDNFRAIPEPATLALLSLGLLTLLRRR